MSYTKLWNRRDLKLPLPPEGTTIETEMEIYARFMRSFRDHKNSNSIARVYTAIRFTADITLHSDAYVAKVLVDLGLRARRGAFPVAYLEFVDRSLMRSRFEAGGATLQSLSLQSFWDEIGEDPFEVRLHDFPVAQIESFV